MKAERGERKLKHAREMALLLVLGFGFAALAKVPAEVFGAFVAGLSTLSGAFVWGNAAEHKATGGAAGDKATTVKG